MMYGYFRFFTWISRIMDRAKTILRTYAHCLTQDDLKCVQAFREALGV